ncbi:MAG: S41 family peptidase [Muribaculaceae bacterium]|nr:S41 family peptidase [Muribaculaceae bacterium]
MKKTILTSVAIASFALSAQAVTPLWLRDVKISPDGTEIAFTYMGDIYKVKTSGGTAQRLTSMPSYESAPIWSPDGKMIAFASDRNGDNDLFIMPSNGGAAKRLTTNSADEIPEAFSPDGSSVIYSAAIQAPAQSALFPTTRMTQLYKVPTTGGRAVQVLGTAAVNIEYVPGTDSFLYEDIKGYEDQWRKHHTSSVTRDIWRYDPKTGRHTNLTSRGGEDRDPTVAPDGITLYLLSERDGGSMNVYSMSLENPGAVKPVTNFTTHPVRFLSIGADGTMAFTYDGEIYTMQQGGTPRKVAIDITVDEVSEPNYFSAGRASGGAAVSPDGKQIAYVNRGEVFVTSVDHSSVKRVTNTPQGESDITWGKDSRELYYTSERDGHYDIYRAYIARPDDPNFSNATVIKEERVFKEDGVDRTYPAISPDGKKLAYISDRNRLMVMDLASKKVKQLTDGTTNPSRTKGFGVEWSPDSKMLLFENTQASHQPYGDIAVIEVESGKLHKITDTGYFDAMPHWALDGKAITFLSERYGMRNHASWGSQYDVMLAFLTKDAYDRYRLSEEDYALLKEVEKSQKKKEQSAKSKTDKDSKGKKKAKGKDEKDAEPAEKKAEEPEYDFDNVEIRTVRLTPNSSDISDALLSDDGESVYYLSSFEGGYDLWKKSLRKRDAKIVNKLNGGGAYLVPDKDGNIFLVGSEVKKFNTKNDRVTSVQLGGRFSIDPAEEREYMLKHVYNEEKERFYVADMNGVDWDGLYKAYARFLPHINNNYDFAELLSELLGELNVSHTGGRYYPARSQEPTASLGLLYDWTYAGPGLKVSEVVERGPFDHAGSVMKAGVVITSVNGVELTDSVDYSALLNGISGKKTLVTFKDAAGNLNEEVILPISSGALNNLLYDRWVKQREDDVARWSDGRLGYVHLQSMSDDSFRTIYAKIMGKYRDLDGIVIDTRWNGGGRLHEDIEVMFSAEPYLTQDIHGMVTSTMPSRRWTKPSIMVIGEANYSNAHGTPWVYKHKGLGKLVGMPVPGTMSSVNWVTLQDPSLVFGIPVIGFRTAEGNYLENTQLEPDIKVANDPSEIVTGEDRQLRTAVETLLRDLKN